MTKLHLTVDEILPDSTPIGEILPTLELLCGAMKSLDLAGKKITPLIGRLMIMIRSNPEIYSRLGYNTFTTFCRTHMPKIGYHRSSVYVSMRLCEMHPALTLGDWIEIGVDKLYWLSKFCKYGDPSYRKYIEAARSNNANDFKLWIAEQGLIEVGDAMRVPVIFNATRTVSKQLDRFLSDPRVHEVVGSQDAGRIVESMMQECTGEWLQEKPLPLSTGIRWRCDWCNQGGDIDLRREKTLDGINRIITDAHRDLAEDCQYADDPGQLIIFLDRD